MINNRQAGRRRGRGGNGQGGSQGGNGPRQGGQRDNGNRIDSRARGNANQLYEKYKNLASDAQRQGDRVNTEYYLQFADHYFRVLSETRNRFEEQQQRNRPDGPGEGRYEAQPFTGSFDAGFDGQDDEFADEGEPIRPGEQRLGEQRGEQAAAGDERPDRGERDGNRRDERPNNQFRREGRPQRDDARPPRDGNRRDEEGDRAPREQGGREQGGREQSARDQGEAQQPRYESRREEARDETPRRAPRQPRRDEDAPVAMNGEAPHAGAPVQPEGDGEMTAEAPRRRGRPRRERPAEEAPAAFDAALLPPSLGIAPAATAVEAEGEEKPRRRRARTAAVEAPAAE